MNPDNKNRLEEFIGRIAPSFLTVEKPKTTVVQTALENIETLGIAAGEYERYGFQDSCLLVKEVFSNIIGKTDALNEEQFELLKQWRLLAGNYIRESKPATAGALTDFFRYKALHADITGDELDVLEDLLKKEGNPFIFLFSDVIEAIEYERPFALNLFNERLEQLLPLLDGRDSTGFVDVCLLLQENMTEITKDGGGLDIRQRQLLIDWIHQSGFLFADKNNRSTVILLLNILQHGAWPNPISSVNVGILLEIFAANGDDTAVSLIPDSLRKPFKNLQDAYIQFDPKNIQTVQVIADVTEDLGMAAEKIGLSGFWKACLFIKQNLSSLNDDPSLDADFDILYIDQWLTLVQHYLSKPDEPSETRKVFDYVTNKAWGGPLPQADLEMLKEAMGIEDNVDDMDDIYTATNITTSGIEVTDAELDDVADETTGTDKVEGLDETTTKDETDACSLEPLSDDSGSIKIEDIKPMPHEVSKELINILRKEAVIIQSEIQSYIECTQDESAVPALTADLFSQYTLHIELFGNACQAAEMDGLCQCCAVFIKSLHHISEDQKAPTAIQLSLISAWPEAVLSYLENLDDESCSNQLVNVLKNEALPDSLPDSVVPAMVELLGAVYVSDKESSDVERQTVVREEDVSIALSDDINQELLDGLLQELPGQTEAFSTAIQAFIDGSAGIVEVQNAQRIAHTLKGAANTVGIKGIAVLMHQLEDIMGALNKMNRLPSPGLANVLMEAADCLEEMSEALVEYRPAPANSVQVLKNVLDWAHRLDSGDSACLGTEQKEIAPPLEDIQTEDKIETATEYSDADAVLRVSVGLIDEILRLLGESMIMVSRLQEHTRLSILQSKQILEHQSNTETLLSDLEIQIESKGPKGIDHNPGFSTNRKGLFDALEFEEYNELNTITHRLVEASHDSYEFNKQLLQDLHKSDELLINKSRLHSEIQELVLRMRQTPIKTIAPRLQRIVRQTCKDTGKQAVLEISGTDILIDSDILNRIVIPLMHILRNAVDHSIETPDERVRLGKSPEGKLQLNFVREGSQIIIDCQDDGAGFDRENIFATAVKHGLIDAGAELSDSEIKRLIFRPGFSTRKEVTQTSGRGVGMDIIHTELLAMKGSIHIVPESGKGCLIELKIPITLMLTHAVLLRQSNRIIAVSNRDVEKILRLNTSKILKTEDGLFYDVDGKKLQMLPLGSLLRLPLSEKESDSETIFAFLVRGEEKDCIVCLEEIIDTRTFFIKSIGKYLNHLKGILGMAILGDGNVIPVIDLPDLINIGITEMEPFGSPLTKQSRSFPVINFQTALVVDDSLSSRRVLSHLMQDAGFEVRVAKDGLEAIADMEKKKPDIILADMEMPRMDGIEFTSHVRHSKNIKNIPIIMVTSRSTSKHRKQAEAAGVNVYVTKPFMEDDLIGHVHELLSAD